MKTRLFVSSAAISVMILTAFVMTRAKADRGWAPSTVRTVAMPPVEGTRPAEFVFPTLGPNETSHVLYRFMTATVKGDFVTVVGMAQIAETDPTRRFLWSMRIFEAIEDGKLLREHHYTDQAIGGEARMTAEFHDVVMLEPGEYRFELTLYGVPATWDWSTVPRGRESHVQDSDGNVLARDSHDRGVTLKGDAWRKWRTHSHETRRRTGFRRHDPRRYCGRGRGRVGPLARRGSVTATKGETAMRLTVEPSSVTTVIDGVPGRFWSGTSAGGARVTLFVTRVISDDKAFQREAERSLTQRLAPLDGEEDAIRLVIEAEREVEERPR